MKRRGRYEKRRSGLRYIIRGAYIRRQQKRERTVRVSRFQDGYNRKDAVKVYRPRDQDPRIRKDIGGYVRRVLYRSVPQEVHAIRKAICKMKRRSIRRAYFGYLNTGRKATGAGGSRFSMPKKCK